MVRTSYVPRIRADRLSSGPRRVQRQRRAATASRVPPPLDLRTPSGRKTLPY